MNTFTDRQGVLFAEDYIIGDTMFPQGKIGWVRATIHDPNRGEMVWVDMDGRSQYIPVRVLKSAKA